MRFSLLLLLLLLPMSVLHAEDKPKEEDKDTTDGRLFEVLADYASTLGDLHNSDFAYIATGKKEYLTRKRGVTGWDINYIGAHQGKDWYHANCYVMPTTSGRMTDIWKQRMAVANKPKEYRNGDAAGDRGIYIETPKNLKDDDFKEALRKLKFGALYPVEIAGSPPQVIRDGTRPLVRGKFIELLFRGDFLMGKYDEKGNLFGHWDYKGDISLETEITFSKTDNWMPTETKIYQRDKGRERMPWGEVQTRWEKQSGKLLPKAIHIVLFGLNGQEDHYDLELQWKIGKQLTEKLIDRDNDDWREPMRKLFGVELWPVPSAPELFVQEKQK